MPSLPLPPTSPTYSPPLEPTSLPDHHANSSNSAASVVAVPITLLSELTQIAAQLPKSVPVAEAEDAVAALCGDPEAILLSLKLEDEDPYEWLDRKLNNICGSWAGNQGSSHWQ